MPLQAYFEEVNIASMRLKLHAGDQSETLEIEASKSYRAICSGDTCHSGSLNNLVLKDQLDTESKGERQAPGLNGVDLMDIYTIRWVSDSPVGACTPVPQAQRAYEK